nr:hypothetical protein [Tanacetum cinerariifolium]
MIEQTASLLANNADLKAQIQEKVFAIAALKINLRKLKGNTVDTKFPKTSVLGKPVLQSLRNQSVVRQLNAFKSERPQISKPRFASQVDVNNNLSRLVTQHYLPKKRESVFAKPDHMIVFSSSRNSSKNMPRFSSNDMVHNYYLEKARKKTHERNRNSKSSVMHTASPQNTTKGSKPKPRSNNQTSRSLPTSVVYEKTSPRSDLRWKPMGRIFKSVGPRWIPTGKLFDSCTSKVDSESPHGSNVDIPNIHECKQTLDVAVCSSLRLLKPNEDGNPASANIKQALGRITVAIKEVSNRFANTLYGIKRAICYTMDFSSFNYQPRKAGIDVGSIMDDSDSEKLKNVFVKDNEKPMNGLVNGARKKVEAPLKKTPRKTGIWSCRKADSPKINIAFFPEMKVHYFDRDDIKEVKHENAYSKKG